MTVEPLDKNDAPAIRRLLEQSGLPTADLDQTAIRFLGCHDEEGLAGVVALELYGSVGLLRSLAVRSSLRGRGLGMRLVDMAEEVAAQNGVRNLYLLTTTAADFFRAGGFSGSARGDAPEAIRGNTEFAGLCPDSAAFMVKQLTAAKA